MIAGVLMAATLASPVLAAESACLQSNRVWGWQAVDDRTLIVTDRNYKRYTVRLTGGCIGLDKYAAAPLVVRARDAALVVWDRATGSVFRLRALVLSLAR